MIVSLEEIGVTYANGVSALTSISLHLNRGEFAVVLGASGAGKSTLLRTINHLIIPSMGKVVVDQIGDLHVPGQLRQHRRRTGMIFQQHQLLERQSVFQNVLMGRLAYFPFWRSLWPLPRADRTLVLDCIARVGLIDKALSPVQSLSGGQKQRVGIARALAQQPQLLLADEPIASLDPGSAHKILSLLRKICKTDNIAALLSLHQVEFAKEYGDRIIGLAAGQIAFDCPPHQLSRHDLDQLYAEPPARAGQHQPGPPMISVFADLESIKGQQ